MTDDGTLDEGLARTWARCKWRPGSRRAYGWTLYHLLEHVRSDRDSQRGRAQVAEYDRLVRGAVRDGLVSEADAAVLMGDDGEEARWVICSIWDFPNDPAMLPVEDPECVPPAPWSLSGLVFGHAKPKWWMDWPAGTPLDETGPNRREYREAERMDDEEWKRRRALFDRLEESRAGPAEGDPGDSGGPAGK